MDINHFSLMLRGNGYWYIIFKSSNGREHWKSTRARTKNEALKVLANFKQRLEERSKGGVSLREFTKEYLEYAEVNFTNGSVEICRFVLKRFLSVVGNLLLSEISYRGSWGISCNQGMVVWSLNGE